MNDRPVTSSVITIDNRPRCKSRGDYLGLVIPCDLERGHTGRHRWVRPESFQEYEWTNRNRRVKETS